MQVLRVETHAHGEGPYQLGDGGPSFHTDAHPSPYKDTGLEEWEALAGLESMEYVFGFSDVEQMFRWWNREFLASLLRGDAYQISVYEIAAHKVFVGGCQVAFHMRRATYAGKRRLEECPNS